MTQKTAQKTTTSALATVGSAATASASSTGTSAGVSLIASGSPLTRLNYFDGKFIRAVDMQTEQAYLRTLVEISNQAGGPGVAYGYSVGLNASGQITLSPGMAIDPKGRVLLLGSSQTLNLKDLLAAPAASSSSSSGSSAFGDCPAGTSSNGTLLQQPGLYLLTICHAETLCGQEDVYGNLCQEACVTSTDRPYIVEGIVVRLAPLTLNTALPVSKAIPLGAQHLRSRVASSFFADEGLVIPDLIAGACLQSDIWCMGADGATGCCVSLGVVGTSNASIAFLDAWTARRERIDPPAKRYWQWRMRMRPWDVYLGQILQFQCQLQDGLGSAPTGPDPCSGTKAMVGEAASVLKEFQSYYKTVSEKLASAATIAAIPKHLEPDGTYLTGLLTRLSSAEAVSLQTASTRLLINQGIIELPSAGYLPVTPGTAATINTQVEQWMGEGVNLRYCIVTPDYVAHALEEAQHMDRISLIEGIDDATKKPDVDILVPNGKAMPCDAADQDLLQAKMTIGDLNQVALPMVRKLGNEQLTTGITQAARGGNLELIGTARAAALDSKGGVFYMAAETTSSILTKRLLDATQQPAEAAGEAATGGTAVASKAAVVDEAAAPPAPPAPAPPTAPEAAPAPVPETGQTIDANANGLQLWTELKSPQNLLDPNGVGSGLVSLRLVLGFSNPKESIALDARLQGDFKRSAVQTRTNAAGTITTTISGTLDGVLTTAIAVEGGASKETTPEHFLYEVQIDIAQTNAGRHLVLALTDTNSRGRLIFQVKWVETSPLKATFEVGIQTVVDGKVTKTIEIVRGNLLQSADVALPGNAYHQKAVGALTALAADLSTPSLVTAGEADLFPKVTKASSPDVIGSDCWVLFQRRRQKDCATCGTTAAAEVLLQYRVYEDRPAKVFYGNAGQPAEIGVVTFSANLTTLSSSVSDLLEEWQTATLGNTIVEGRIYSVSQNAIDRESTALMRLHSVEEALSSATTLARPTRNYVEKTLPPATFDTSGVDGIILIATEQTGQYVAKDVAAPKRARAKKQ